MLARRLTRAIPALISLAPFVFASAPAMARGHDGQSRNVESAPRYMPTEDASEPTEGDRYNDDVRRYAAYREARDAQCRSEGNARSIIGAVAGGLIGRGLAGRDDGRVVGTSRAASGRTADTNGENCR